MPRGSLDNHLFRIFNVARFTGYAACEYCRLGFLIWGTVHHGWNWETIVIGISFLIYLLITKYIAKKRNKLFWVAAIAKVLNLEAVDKFHTSDLLHLIFSLEPYSLSLCICI